MTDGVTVTVAAVADATPRADVSAVPAQLLSRRAIRERMMAEAAAAAEQAAAEAAAAEQAAVEAASAAEQAAAELSAAEQAAAEIAAAVATAALQTAAAIEEREASVPIADAPAAPAALFPTATVAPVAAESAASDDAGDAFERASRLFRAAASENAAGSENAAASENGAASENSAPSVDESAAQTTTSSAPAAEHVAPRRRVRRFVTLGASLGVMSIAGMLAISMTLPAEAVAAVQGGGAASLTSLVAASGAADARPAADEIQAFVTSSEVQNESLVRADSFSTVSLVQVAAEQGINYSGDVFVNDPDAAIQWPFLVGVGMTYGYGMRSGRLHEGIDFVPGNGAPIQAIADGVVRIATEQGGAYGVTVYIDHVIDGQTITSHYAHMQYGSLQVSEGQTVKVGTVLGKTGNTGRSYGAHLHFELIVNGTTIDPLPWMQANAGRDSY